MQPIELDQTNAKTFIFIDGSYYCFYRYYSLINWWKLAHPEIILEDPFNNETFVLKFKKTFVENIINIPKKLSLKEENENENETKNNIQIIVGRDCKRANIWRHEFCAGYKGTRDKPGEIFYGANFFKMAYDDELFLKGGANNILHHPKLEADDVIAISVKLMLEKHPNCKIYIITSDKDYLQLLEPRVKIYNLAFKNIADQKSCYNDAKKDLFLKIVMGDKSDNISSVLKKCGPKTAIKCYEDDKYFQDRLAAENAHEKYALNKKIIDFNEIPKLLVDEFMQSSDIII
jgi:5'-3' exonuclease